MQKIQNKEVRNLVKWAESQGFEYTMLKNNHILCRKGNKTVTISSSPSCVHAIKNAKKDLMKSLKH